MGNSNMRKMYTEEQIKKIGGTKLYKHKITLDTNDDLYLLNNIEEKILNSQLFTDFPLTTMLSGFCSSANNGSGVVLSINDSWIYYWDNDSEDVLKITFSSIVSDTVTPL